MMKLCKDCKHYIPPDTPLISFAPGTGECKRFQISKDVVTGYTEYYSAHRARHMHCGRIVPVYWEKASIIRKIFR